MAKAILSGRLTEKPIGRLLGVLLTLLWITGMSAIDSNPCTLSPFLWVLAGMALITAGGIACGLKIVKLPVTAWLSLAAALYYLWRASTGFSVIENLSDIGLILGAIAFYLAGLFTGQHNSSRGCTIVLSIAILLNLGAMWLMRQDTVNLHWLGRVNVSLTGENSRHVTLYVYKNFAGLMLSLCGSLLIWRAMLRGEKSLKAALPALIGLAGIAASFFCGTRVIWLVLPLALAAGWVLWIVMKLYTNRPLGWGMIGGGVVLLVAILISAYDFLFDNSLVKYFSGVESHTRFLIWECINRVLPEASLTGFGPGGSQWEIISFYPEWQQPNYAHNEYLQLWADYGLIGLGTAVALLLLHVIQGFRALASEHISAERRCKTALALLSLGLMSCAAVTDFVWHNFSLLSLTAFTCGTLASPFPQPPMSLFSRRNWAPECRPAAQPVKAQGRGGRVVVSVLLLALSTAFIKLSNILTPVWSSQWEFEQLVAQKAPVKTLRSYLLSILRTYPDTRIADYIITMAPTTEPDWNAYEQGLRYALAGNPRQLCTAAMLAQTLDRLGRHKEAEDVFRSYYPGDGPDNQCLTRWATLYASNLQRWGRMEMLAGNPGCALSLLQYAEQIAKVDGGFTYAAPYRKGTRTWTEWGTEQRRQFIRSCKTDIDILQTINPPPDHSWQEPLKAGGKPALYKRYMK